MVAFFNRKVLLFGLLGAAGCLAGWALGEGLLWAALPRADSPDQAPAPTIVTRPGAIPPPASPAPPPPGALAAASGPAAAALPPDIQKLLDDAGGKSGEVQITLWWKNTNDLDLHCLDPSKEHIYFNHKVAASGGTLDVDRNAGGILTNNPIENIRWLRNAPLGTYRVFIHHYNNNGAPDPTPFTVSVLAGGRRQEFKGSLRHGDDPQLIHQFEIRPPEPAIRLAASPRLEINQGTTNRLPVKVARDNFTGPVKLALEGDTQGLTAAEVTLPDGKSDAEIEVKAALDVKGGSRACKVAASGGGVRGEAPVSIEVKLLPPAVRLAVPPEVVVTAGGKNTVPVNLVRDYFAGPVTLSLKGDAGQMDGLELAEVTVPADKSEAQLELLAGRRARDGTRSVRLTAAGGEAKGEQAFQVKIDPRPVAPWSWRTIVTLGLWTALVAVGLSLALVAGQNYSMGRPLLSGRELLVLAGGGLAAGVLAGGLGQTLFSLLNRAELLPHVGFVAGWILLGALLGWAVSLFIPNMSGVRATAAGAAGGLAGALVFLGASLLHDVVGRLLGAVLLGFFIGLMVALVEMAFRKAWLEVVYGPREIGTVNLGEWPIAVGSDRKACTVYARGTEPVAYRYLFKGGKVLCEDVSRGQSVAVPLGHKQTIGSVEVIVRGAAAGSGDDTAAPTAPVVSRATASPRPAPAKPAASPAPAVPPAPPPSPDRPYPDRKPATASPDRPYPAASPGTAAPRGGAPPAAAPPAKPADKPAAGSGCPGCGRPVPGQPGRRYCVVCDRTF